MPLLFLLSALVILAVLVYHYTITRGAKWAAIFTACALFFGAWHEANPLREQDPEYRFSSDAITILGIPLVGVIGWVEVIYLSWFLCNTLLPKVMRTRILIVPALVSGLMASLFALCIETTGIKIGWWIWREDRQSIIFPMGGWAVQVLLFSALFFAIFHSTKKTKLLLLGVMILVAPTFLPSFERHWFAHALQGAGVLLFVIFARFEPRGWAVPEIWNEPGLKKG